MTLSASSPTLKNKLNDVHRGAYWFGIVGRLSIFWGLLTALNGFFLMTTIQFDVNHPLFIDASSALGNALMPLACGKLFLFGRDAFHAIEALITEMNEIV